MKISELKRNLLSVLFLLFIFVVCFGTIVSGGSRLFGFLFNSIKSVAQNRTDYNTLSGILPSFETDFSDNILFKKFFIEMYGLFNRAVNKKVLIDKETRYNIYKMNNGQLTWNYSDYDIESFQTNYVAFKNDLDGNDIPLLFIQAPFKIDKYNNNLPYGIEDTTNKMADDFLRFLVKNKCQVLDLRKVIHEKQYDYSSLFYNTDHHWKPQTGLWATAEICNDIVNSVNSVPLNTAFLDESEYSFTDFNRFFLGSQGKRTGRFFSGMDDFTVIEPKYDTDYSVSVPVINLYKEGAYDDSLLFPEYFSGDYYESDPGRVYTGDNYSNMIVNNKISTNETKLLLIKDSFSRTVIPFLASTCKTLHVIDLRTFEGSVVKYAVDNDVDMVLTLYNPSVVVNADFFDFD